MLNSFCCPLDSLSLDSLLSTFMLKLRLCGPDFVLFKIKSRSFSLRRTFIRPSEESKPIKYSKCKSCIHLFFKENNFISRELANFLLIIEIRFRFACDIAG